MRDAYQSEDTPHVDCGNGNGNKDHKTEQSKINSSHAEVVEFL